jgi:CBS domain-containing protein
MTSMKRLLDVKGYKLYSIPHDTKAAEALRMMGEKKIGFLVVMDGERMVGVFSERDIIRLLNDSENYKLNQPIHQVMTTPVISVGLDTSVDECLGIMADNDIRHVPVMDRKQTKVVGVVSIRDVVREAVADRETTARGLQKYLGTGYYT